MTKRIPWKISEQEADEREIKVVAPIMSVIERAFQQMRMRDDPAGVIIGALIRRGYQEEELDRVLSLILRHQTKDRRPTC